MLILTDVHVRWQVGCACRMAGTISRYHTACFKFNCKTTDHDWPPKGYRMRSMCAVAMRSHSHRVRDAWFMIIYVIMTVYDMYQINLFFNGTGIWWMYCIVLRAHPRCNHVGVTHTQASLVPLTTPYIITLWLPSWENWRGITGEDNEESVLLGQLMS